MTHAAFHELGGAGLIAAEGADAVAFLHAQLTSDVAALAVSQTQYSGYCSPKGRLLATFLLWRTPEGILLQLPRAMQEPVQMRLAKYVLRAKVGLSDATPDWKLIGVSGNAAATAVAPLSLRVPAEAHDACVTEAVAMTRLPDARYLVLARAAHATAVREQLQRHAREEPESRWMQLDIAAGVPWVTSRTQDEYIPQMVNLDLIGAVSYGKGCYPGQEIVARTHYLGRLKQRMYRIRLPGEQAPEEGDRLYSAAFGSAQACGSIVNAAAHANGSHEALAVIQTQGVSAGSVHWNSPEGPAVELLGLPYRIPD